MSLTCTVHLLRFLAGPKVEIVEEGDVYEK